MTNRSLIEPLIDRAFTENPNNAQRDLLAAIAYAIMDQTDAYRERTDMLREGKSSSSSSPGPKPLNDEMLRKIHKTFAKLIPEDECLAGYELIPHHDGTYEVVLNVDDSVGTGRLYNVCGIIHDSILCRYPDLHQNITIYENGDDPDDPWNDTTYIYKPGMSMIDFINKQL